MIGTPFVSNDEITQRKVDKINKKPWEQTPVDENGRKRFHGAFTGGFSAGYFNTCGSKEGWQPTNYKVGEKEKIKKKQTIYDFMDEEDIKDQVGLHTITKKDGNHDFDMNESNKTFGHSIITGKVPEELKLQFNNNIGQILMSEAGFNQRNVKKNIVYGCHKPGEIQNESNLYYNGPLEFKDNLYGIGYVPSVDELFMKKKEEKNKMMTNKSRDDLLLYDIPDKSQYSFEEINIESDNVNFKNKAFDFKKRSEPPKQNEFSIKFVKSDSKLQIPEEIIKFELPKLPPDYDPFKKRESNKNDEILQNPKLNYGKLDPEKRSKLISEKFISNSSLQESAIKKEEEKQTQKLNFLIEIPFKNDPAKISRFAQFIAEKEGLYISDEFFASSNMMTASQIREEKALFSSLYEEENKTRRAQEYIENEKKSNLPSEVVKDEMTVIDKIESLKNKLTKREKVKWLPCKLLCKRFKIKDPYDHLVIFDNDKKGKFERGDDLKNATIMDQLNSVQKNILKEEEKMKNMIKNPNYEKAKNNERNSEIIVNSSVDVSIFDQIFGD